MDEGVPSSALVSSPVPAESPQRPSLGPDVSVPLPGEAAPALPPLAAEPVMVSSSDGSLNVGVPSHPGSNSGQPVVKAYESGSSALHRSRESPPSWPRGTAEMVKVCMGSVLHSFLFICLTLLML